MQTAIISKVVVKIDNKHVFVWSLFLARADRAKHYLQQACAELTTKLDDLIELIAAFWYKRNLLNLFQTDRIQISSTGRNFWCPY